MASANSTLDEIGPDYKNKLDQMLDKAIVELETRKTYYDEEALKNEKILKEFGLADYCQLIQDHAVEAYSAGPHEIVNNVDQMLDKRSSELAVSQLQTYLKSLQMLKSLFEEYLVKVEMEMKKYENEYFKECRNSSQDGIDFTTLQTNIHKLTADIHQANEQQEPKNVITGKLLECFEIKEEIKKSQIELDSIKIELSSVRHLPLNIMDAERKLNDLKKKYKEISNEFTKKAFK